jgi:hypothetical protein
LPFDWRTFRTLFREAFRDPMSPRRRAVVWTAFTAIPLLAGVNALCFGLDRLLFPGLRKTPVREPVFIIGHARSGMTSARRSPPKPLTSLFKSNLVATSRACGLSAR